MVNIFEAGYLALGAAGLLIGAVIGELLARRFPNQRIFIAVGLYACLAVSVLSGADFNLILAEAVKSSGDPQQGIGWFVGKQIFLIGLISGAALFTQQRRRGAQVFAMAVSAVVGLPILMNFWMGAGITYAMHGYSA